MYICICNGITEEQLEKVAKQSNTDKEVLSRLGIGNSCGICLLEAIHKINPHLKKQVHKKSAIHTQSSK